MNIIFGIRGVPRALHHTGLLFLLLLLCAGCADRQDADRREILRDLPPDMIRHLVSSDDSTLALYGREAGIVVLLDAAKRLDERMCGMYIESEQHAALALITYYKRIARVLASEYGYDLYRDRLIFIESLSPGIRHSLIELESDYYSFRSEIHLPAEDKIERYIRYLERFGSYGDLLFVALCEYEISYAYGATGDERKRIEYLRAAHLDFARCGLHEMTCPTLCELGRYYETIGEIDSMVFCFEEAKRIAHRSRLPWEAAQISALYARHYARHGRLSLAYDLLNNAMELCRRYKGEYSELEFIVETMIFQADIGCWDIVDRLIERARVLQSAYGGRTKKYIKLYAFQIDRIEARMWMARGHVEKAESIFRRTEQAIDDLIMPYTQEPEKAKLFIHWSKGLLENGRLNEALEIIGDGLRLSTEANLPEFPARFALLEAQAAFRRGDMQASGRALRQFEALAQEDVKALQREWIERDALLGEMGLSTGDGEAAVHALEEGLARLERAVMSMDASVQSYLWIGECGKLRRLMHDIVSHDPLSGFGAELYWRDFYRMLGRQGRRAGGMDSVRAPTTAAGTVHPEMHTSGMISNVLRERAVAARTRIEKAGAVHSVYLVRGDEIWRWTASPAGVRREVLDASADGVRKCVTGAWNMMSNGYAAPDSISPAALHLGLRTLAHMLLPDEVLHAPAAQPGELFLVTADGFLGLIPFETFDVGEKSEYIPLLMHRDVAYLRHADGPAGGPEPAPGVILANAEPSKRLLKRYPFQPVLEEVMAEGESAASLNPGARFLAGESASKSNLLSIWENASFIYMATHMLRDPQVPYLTLIPLAAPGASSVPEAAYLDVTDIRAADFSRCHTVILSGCSSGAPYLETRISGPSLGDAFLDSGAGEVVHTFWDVLDSETRRFTTSYMRAWGRPGYSSIRALCDVRREAFLSSRRARHPFGWASYSIKVGRL